MNVIKGMALAAETTFDCNQNQINKTLMEILELFFFQSIYYFIFVFYPIQSLTSCRVNGIM